MLLTDIVVEHKLISPGGEIRGTFLLHPFTDTQRDTFGKYELVRNIGEPGEKEVRRSTYVTFSQLAELYAKGMLEEFGFSVRMCPERDKYPTKNPARKIQPANIKSGSPFDLAVRNTDLAKPASRELRNALLRTNVKV